MLAEPAPAGANGDRPLRVLGVGRMVAKKGFDVLVDACGVLQRRGVAVRGRDRRPGGQALRRGAGRASPRRGLGVAGEPARPDGAGGAAARVPPRERALHAEPAARRRPRRHPERPRRGDGGRHAGRSRARVSGIPELVEHEVNGLLVAPEDPEALADTLLRLHGDPALSHELAAARAGDRRGPLRRRAPGEPARRAVPGSDRDEQRRRRRPRPVLCVTEHEHRSRAVADGVRAGRFTVAGETRVLGPDPDWLGARAARGRGVADRVGEVRVGARPRPRGLPACATDWERLVRVVDPAGPAGHRRRRGDRAAGPQLDLRLAAAHAVRRPRGAAAREPRRPGRPRAREPRPGAQPPHARAVRAVRRRARAARARPRRRLLDFAVDRARPQPAHRLPPGRRPPRGLDALPPDRAALVRRRARERAPLRRRAAGRVRRPARPRLRLRRALHAGRTGRSRRSRTPTTATTGGCSSGRRPARRRGAALRRHRAAARAGRRRSATRASPTAATSCSAAAGAGASGS